MKAIYLSLSILMCLPMLSLADGKSDYMNFCSGCHGVNADGKGQDALTTKRRPLPLTHLQQANGGHFPYKRVRQIVDGRVEKGNIRHHYSTGMPVWGDVFSKFAGGVSENIHSEIVVKVRILDLVDYIASIQIIDLVKITTVPIEKEDN